MQTMSCFKKMLLRRKTFTSVAIFLALVVTFYNFMISSKSDNLQKVSNRMQFRQILNIFAEKHHINVSDIKKACVQPSLKPFEGNYLKHFKHVSPLKCASDEDWLEVRNGTLYSTEHARTNHGDVKCSLRFIERKSDVLSVYRDAVEVSTNLKSGFVLPDSFFKANCESSGTSKAVYDNVHATIPFKHEIHERQKVRNSGLGLDVLMIGFDSLSHMTFIRKLPKTVQYFKEKMSGIVLNGYNVVGDGTGHALTPILTGKIEEELPNTLKTVHGTKHNDVWPFIWQDLRKNGYATLYAEDQPYIQTYNLRLRGFDQQPTDHYMRPFYLQAVKEFKNHKKLCFGSKRRSSIFLNYMKDFYTMYANRSKFAFGFHSELSHDDVNIVETADEDIKYTIEYLHNGGFLNNTMFILMSDHGARFSSMRATLQGKMEERLPFFGFYLPPWFKQKHKIYYDNLLKNVDRLSTPFDIHETIRDMIDFGGETLGDVNKRGISLFQEIPLSRTCEDASVGTHWCTCLNWEIISNTDVRVQRVAAEALTQINNITKHLRDKCVELKLNRILIAQFYSPQRALLKFKKTGPNSKYDLSDNTKVDSHVLQVTLETSPSGGMFELTADVINNQIKIKDGISRINKYGNAPKCIEGEAEDLRKYCYCKEMLLNTTTSASTQKTTTQSAVGGIS